MAASIYFTKPANHHAGHHAVVQMLFSGWSAALYISYTAEVVLCHNAHERYMGQVHTYGAIHVCKSRCLSLCDETKINVCHVSRLLARLVKMQTSRTYARCAVPAFTATDTGASACCNPQHAEHHALPPCSVRSGAPCLCNYAVPVFAGAHHMLRSRVQCVLCHVKRAT